MVPRTKSSHIETSPKFGNFRCTRLPTPIVQHRPHSPHSDNLNTSRLPTPLCNMQHATCNVVPCNRQHGTMQHRPHKIGRASSREIAKPLGSPPRCNMVPWYHEQKVHTSRQVQSSEISGVPGSPLQ